MDIRSHNRAAWDLLSRAGDRWCVPVTREEIAAARQGRWSVQLTNSKPVPRTWFPASLAGLDVLALASGGGQQGPIMSAAGAQVTVVDISPEQLAKDQLVATRERLPLRTLECSMDDLRALEDASFDLVFNPTSVLFVSDVRRVWQEAARVLRPGGTLLAGFVNPAVYLFDRVAVDGGAPLAVKHRLPYTDERDLAGDELSGRVGRREPLEYSHSFEALIGGQLDAGLQLIGMYEDVFGDAALDAHMPTLIATRAIKANGR